MPSHEAGASVFMFVLPLCKEQSAPWLSQDREKGLVSADLGAYSKTQLGTETF